MHAGPGPVVTTSAQHCSHTFLRAAAAATAATAGGWPLFLDLCSLLVWCGSLGPPQCCQALIQLIVYVCIDGAAAAAATTAGLGKVLAAHKGYLRLLFAEGQQHSTRNNALMGPPGPQTSSIMLPHSSAALVDTPAWQNSSLTVWCGPDHPICVLGALHRSPSDKGHVCGAHRRC